jgi:UDP-glucose 6-dehydrogenase
MPFYEPGLEPLVKKNLKENRLSFTDNISDAIKKFASLKMRENIVKHARLTVEENYSLQSVVQNYINFIIQVANLK